MINLYIIGDSTAANKSLDSRPETGWGEKLGIFLTEDIVVHNHAINGRSTKSFLDEGRFNDILKQLKSDDYVMIQFGHNDQKVEDPKRYTSVYESYPKNLSFMINEIKEKKAVPIIISSISRRNHLANHRVNPLSVGLYPYMSYRVARSKKAWFIDGFTRSKKLYEYLGMDLSRKLFNQIKKEDNTHFNQFGAIAIASIIAEGLLRTPLSEYVLPMSLLRNVDVKRLAQKL